MADWAAVAGDLGERQPWKAVQLTVGTMIWAWERLDFQLKRRHVGKAEMEGACEQRVACSESHQWISLSLSSQTLCVSIVSPKPPEQFYCCACRLTSGSLLTNCQPQRTCQKQSCSHQSVHKIPGSCESRWVWRTYIPTSPQVRPSPPDLGADLEQSWACPTQWFSRVPQPSWWNPMWITTPEVGTTSLITTSPFSPNLFNFSLSPFSIHTEHTFFTCKLLWNLHVLLMFLLSVITLLCHHGCLVVLLSLHILWLSPIRFCGHSIHFPW